MKPERIVFLFKEAWVLCFVLLCFLPMSAQNPFLPLWEYVPDAEPYVFEDPDNPGKYRVYIYGSHDSLKDKYCGREQVLWSAPVDDLGNWRYDGVIFTSTKDADGNLLNQSGEGDILYAPDIVETIDKDGQKTYYFYPNNQSVGREGMIAKSNRPDGPFEVCNWNPEVPTECVGDLRFDPAVFIDDDGKVYGYWGFQESWGAELDPVSMATVKSGTQPVKDLIPNLNQNSKFKFFEASSMRKIKDKYILIYSRWTENGEFGLSGSNYTLAYAYSQNPLGPFTYGGTIIDGRGRGTDYNGHTVVTATPGGNTHGSIVEINGQWYVFYHRQTGTNEYARQAMVAPIEVEVQEGAEGRVIISEGEYNSEGFALDGLDPTKCYSAGIACYYTGPTPASQSWPNFIHSGSYIQPTYFDGDKQNAPSDLILHSCPVVNNTDGSIVGYKYFNFDRIGDVGSSDAVFTLKPLGIDGKVEILVGSPWVDRGGHLLGQFEVSKEQSQTLMEMHVNLSGLKEIKGKQPVFFAFSSETKGRSICELYDFTLSTTWEEQLAVAKGIDNDSLPYAVAEMLEKAMNVDITSLNPEQISVKISELVKAIGKAHEVAPSYRIYLEMKKEAEGIIANSTPKEENFLALYKKSVDDASQMISLATDKNVIDEICANLEKARRDYVVNAVPVNGSFFDMTFLVVNSGCMDTSGWKTEGLGNFGPMQNVDMKGEYRGDVFFEKWGSSEEYVIKGKRGIYQTLSGLPDGDYELKAAAFRRCQFGEYFVPDSAICLFFNEGKKGIVSETLDYTVVRGSVLSHVAELGLWATVANTANWMGISDVHLYYYGYTDSFLKKIANAYEILVGQAYDLASDNSGIYDKDLQASLLALLDEQASEEPSGVDGYEEMMEQLRLSMDKIKSSASVQAVWIGSQAEAGKSYFLYNVGLGKFLGNGYGYWGTQGGWNDYGIEVKLESAGSEGSFYLNIPQLGDNSFFGWLNTSSASTATLPSGIDAQYYMNSTSSKEKILFTEVSMDGIDHVYEFVLPDNADKVLCYNARYPTVLCVNEVSENGLFKWQLVSREERMSRMKSKDEAGNATFVLSNPDFIGQYTGWDGYTDYNFDNIPTGQHLRTSDYRGYFHAQDKTFDISQSLEGMPAGTYTLSAKGYYRPEKTDGEVTSFLYAGHESVPFQSLYNCRIASQLVGAGEQSYESEGMTYYCPEMNMPDITLFYFDCGLYDNSLTFYYDGDAPLKIGFRDEVGRNGSWTDIAEVSLTYHGSGDLTGIDSPITNEVSQREDNLVYDLIGRRVSKPSRGIYIMNGKKILVR